jgi:multidrug efflux pump subunit AcrB
VAILPGYQFTCPRLRPWAFPALGFSQPQPTRAVHSALADSTFNVASFMGMIMVIGIVAKNGILLLDADQKFRGLGFSAEDAMLQASRRRLRPIVMTALATVAGMLPLAFALGAGSQMLQPLAIAVIGGIMISMILSLIITPAVHYYLSHEETKAKEPTPAQA